MFILLSWLFIYHIHAPQKYTSYQKPVYFTDEDAEIQTTHTSCHAENKRSHYTYHACTV